MWPKFMLLKFEIQQVQNNKTKYKHHINNSYKIQYPQ